VNGIGEASAADFGITGAKNEGLIFSRGKPLRKVPTGQLVDVLFEEIDKYATTKKIVVDDRAAAEGAAWLAENEDATALTPERLAAIEQAESEAHGGGDDVLALLDEDVSPVAGRRFTRA
jgi:(E)-4-hydroxy-3-methylbut-2-enyl-diphosphate synthase